jgi:hypothetical protein
MSFSMNKSSDYWTWSNISPKRWRGAVNLRLRSVYLVTINDAGIDDELLRSHWEMKEPANEFVEWFATKYDLEPKSSVGLGF